MATGPLQPPRRERARPLDSGPHYDLNLERDSPRTKVGVITSERQQNAREPGHLEH